MSPAASRFAALAVLVVWFGAESLGADEPPARLAPSRPVEKTAALPPLATTRLNNLPYVDVDDAFARLALKAKSGGGRKVVFGENQLVIEADSREAAVDGLRVFLGEPILARKGQLYVSKTDFERCLAPLLRPGFGVSALPPPKVIALDPGHGGKDDGAENERLGLKEKILTLDVALRLKKILEAAGYKVVMIRSDDKTLSADKTTDLSMRPEFANRHGADLFVSIHFNVASRDARGTEIFTYTPPAQHATDWWGGLTKEDPQLMLEEQPINRFDHWNMVLAESLHRRMLKILRTEDRGKKIAHWAVLKTLDCPGVLVEPAIISNDGEARRVATAEFRQQVAESLAAGIVDYSTILASLQRKPNPPPATPPRQATSNSP